MNVKELKKYLSNFDPDAEVLVSSDEELNNLFTDLEITYLHSEEKEEQVVIYGLSGSDVA